MTLFQNLQTVSSEEDVKKMYIKALGLKNVRLNLIDMQTEEVWFEAKGNAKSSTYEMFTQLLFYVREARKKGENIPAFCCVVDTVKAAIMETRHALVLIDRKDLNWGKSAGKFSQEALQEVSQHIGTYFVAFRIETHEREFIETVKTAIKSGKILRTPITPDNLKQVFDKWVTMIGREIIGVKDEDMALLFFADVMSDGTVSKHENLPAELLHKGKKPLFLLEGKLYELRSHKGYEQFWAIYHRPPKDEHQNYLLERRDSLIPLDDRIFKGAYYTPLHVVDKAYDLLTQTLGKNWQQKYIVWDMCCGVGNLETKHFNLRNVFMSTLDQADIAVMKATKTCVEATRFQYDYLNDDITDDGKIDYSLTNKVPKKLQESIKDGKKILVLMNPPYAEATNASNTSVVVGAKNKAGVAKTKVGTHLMEGYGKSSNEKFVHFLARIATEIPKATIAMFSKMKHVNAPNFEQFREKWNAKFLSGFVVHNQAFDGHKGHFPIGFLIWQTAQKARNRTPIDEISVEVIDKNGNPMGEKSFYNIPRSRLLNAWIKRPPANQEPAIPLSNAAEQTAMKSPRVQTWSDGAIGYMCTGTNDLQNAGKYTFLLSSVAARGNGLYVNKNNLAQCAVVFSVQRLVKHTWLNDRDQFLQPSGKLTERFKNDCLVWMLFNGSNLSASADDLEWDGKKWSIVNHFIPYTAAEVGASEHFESDFMVRYLADKTLSREARHVLEAGKVLWQAYFSDKDNRAVCEKLKINRADVGWYQIRNALKMRNESGNSLPVDFGPFEKVYTELTEELRPRIYELGFLK